MARPDAHYRMEHQPISLPPPLVQLPTTHGHRPMLHKRRLSYECERFMLKSRGTRFTGGASAKPNSFAVVVETPVEGVPTEDGQAGQAVTANAPAKQGT